LFSRFGLRDNPDSVVLNAVLSEKYRSGSKYRFCCHYQHGVDHGYMTLETVLLPSWLLVSASGTGEAFVLMLSISVWKTGKIGVSASRDHQYRTKFSIQFIDVTKLTKRVNTIVPEKKR
jgi:hypothetical protein